MGPSWGIIGDLGGPPVQTHEAIDPIMEGRQLNALYRRPRNLTWGPHEALLENSLAYEGDLEPFWITVGALLSDLGVTLRPRKPIGSKRQETQIHRVSLVS